MSTPPSSNPSPDSPSDQTARTIRSERVFNILVIGAMALGFLTLITVAALGAVVMRQNLSYTAWVAHTYEVEASISDFGLVDERIEGARRAFLLSRDPRFARTVHTVAGHLTQALDRIQALTADNPVQLAHIAAIRPILASQLQACENSLVAANGQADIAAFYDDAGVAATRNIRAIIRKMAAEEQLKLQQRSHEREESVQLLISIAIAAGLLLLFVGLGSLWVILRYTRDLTLSRRQLGHLNANLEGEVRSRTSDLQRANDEIQRFAYIVSHDLRSPLVNVMGFTSELESAAKPLAQLLERAEAEAPQIVTEDARAAVRSDLPESIGFIRTSTQKMDRLINAILRLSREGRRVLTPETVDMARLLDVVADNLKHRSTALGAQIEIDPQIPTVVSDRLALEQVFSNLIENALKYLKPDRPGRIQVRGERRGERIVYEVIDNGRGIDPKDHERIFDLFRRSGTQDQPGEGIGLAHVRALTYRLGGVIDCQSALDQGATFRVSLPAKLTAEGVPA